MVVSRPDPALGIFIQERHALVRYAMRLTANHADAEDVVQQAWLRFVSADRGEALAQPAYYLRRIIRNLVFDRRRYDKQLGKHEQQDCRHVVEQVASDHPSALAELVVRDELRIVRETVISMPERMRRAFELHRIERLTLVEIAARLGISKSLAHTLVIEGLERCKQALREAD